MILGCLFIIHAVGVFQADSAEIPIHHMRASKALAFMQKLETADPNKPVSMVADDAKGLIIAKGNPDGIKDIRSVVNLIDVARRKVPIQVTISSEIEKISYDASATVLNTQAWSTSDSDTGVTAYIQPRINDDSTVTLYLALGTVIGKPELRMVYRMKPGESKTFSVDRIGIDLRKDAEKSSSEKHGLVPDLKVKITLGKM